MEGLPAQLAGSPLISWCGSSWTQRPRFGRPEVDPCSELRVLHCGLSPLHREPGSASHISPRPQVGLPPGSYEAVIVEDASEDRTEAVLHHLAKSRPYAFSSGNVLRGPLRSESSRVMVCRASERGLVIDTPRQRGVAGSLHVGWAECRGAFIARLDADDEAQTATCLLASAGRSISIGEAIAVPGAASRGWEDDPTSSIQS